MSRRSGAAVLLLVCIAASCRTTGPAGQPGGTVRPRARLATGTIPPYAPSQPFGYVPGTFTADASGAATFNLPIVVPPGTAGVEPTLSLAYTSHRENGYVGMGWQLSGLSAIGRCGANYELDGYKAGVAFDARDRYCLDGNRLVAVSGSYGADGTVYHTERETQTSVISNGACGNGPCSFTAYNKNGERLSFGGTADSRILAQGRIDGTVRAWAIDRQTDLNGNYTAIVYTNDVAAGEYVPLRIDYTGNDRTGLQPQRRVDFAYESRTDPVKRYLAGSLVQVTKRLRTIKTSVSGATVQTYTIDYGTSAFTQRSRAKSVTVCDSAGVCLPPVSFEWQTEAEDFAPAAASLPGPLYVIVNNRVYPLGILQDFDGDGIADYSVATEFLGGAPKQDLAVWRGKPDGTFTPAGFSLPGPIFRATSSNVVMCGVLQDINGDAILDFSPATYNASTGQSDLSVYLGTRNGFTKASFSLPDAVYWTVNGQTIQTGILSDMNGDGIPDYSRATRLTSSNQLLLSIFQGTGNGFTATGKSLPGPLFAVSSNISMRVGVLQDINGDGIADYSPATVNSNGSSDLSVWLGQTPDFAFVKSFDLPGQLLWIVNGQSLDSGLLVDLNGDGIPDYSRATELLSTRERILDVYLGTGAGFVDSGFDIPGPIFLISSGRAEIAGVLTQMNGDGTSRFSRAAKFSNGPTDLTVYLGSGAGFRLASFSMPEPLFDIVDQQVYAKGIYEDLNGDGMTDFANSTCTMTQPGIFTNCSLSVRLAKGPFSDLLSVITNSFGGTTRLEYKPISDPAIYTRGDTPAYPVRDAQSATYALSRYVDSDARGATYAFSYDYTGARFDVRGRDWLGFTKITMTEEAGGRQSETTYSMVYPYYGLITETAMRAGDGKRLETTANTYGDFAPASHQALGIHQALQTSITDTMDQDGAPAFSYGRNYDYDQYGNRTFEEQRGNEATGVLPLFSCARYLNDSAPNVNRLGFTLQKKSTRTAEACRAFLAVPDGAGVHWDPATDLRWSKKSYDSNLNVLSEEDWDNTHSVFVTTTYTVDPYGNPVTTAAPSTGVFTYTYDATYHTFLETITSPPLTRPGGGTYTLRTGRLTEPHFGVLVQTTDANGNILQQEADGFGRLVGVWGPDPQGVLVQLVSTLWKNDGGNYLDVRTRPSWTWSADPSTWYWARTRYDGLARQYRGERNGLKQGRPATIVTEMFYDALGRVHRQAAPYYDGDPAPIITTDYDALNRPTLTTDPSNVKERLVYQDGGLRVSLTQAYDTPEASTSIQLMDVEGRTRQRVSPNGQSVTYGYDALGQLITVSSAPLSRPAAVAYDSLGNVLSVDRADTGKTTMVFDSANRFRKVTDAFGNTIEIDTYDALRRVGKRTAKYGGQTSVWSFIYDETAYRNGLSHLTTAIVEAPVLGTATYHYAWDAYQEEIAGEVTRGGTTYRYSSTSDPTGRPSEEIYPDGAVVSLHYGADENLAGIDVTDPGAAQARTWATLTNYTAAGQLQDLAIDENGVQVSRRYYPNDVAFGKLRSIDAKSTRQNNRSLLSLTYSWNPIGEITGIADNDDPAQSQTFGYRDQALNRGMGFLTGAAGAYGAKSFRYEELGNITQQNETTYTYEPGTDRISGSSGGVTWQFSPNGFLRTRTEDANRNEYTFDADGKLVGITRSPAAGGTATSLLQAAYDHTGRKVLETTAGGTFEYVIAGYEVQSLPGGIVQHTRSVGGPFGRLASVTANGTGVETLQGASQRNRVRALMAGNASMAGRATGAWFTLLSIAVAPLTMRIAGVALLSLWILAAFALTRMTMRAPTAYARWRPGFACIAPLVAAAVALTAAMPAYADLSPGQNGPGVPTDGRLFFIQNLIGSTVSVTGEDGAETAHVAYEPYGRVDQPSSRGVDNFRPKFSGKTFEPENGLYDFTARRFDPLLGRFISPDPQNQYFSPYLYGGSDPISMIDPTGEFAFIAAIVVGAIIGAYFGAASVNGTYNPLHWNWQSGKTWAGIFGGAAIGAVGAAAGGLVVQAGIAVGSMGGTAAQVAGVAIGIAGEALIGAGENAAFTALGGGTSREIVESAAQGAFFGAVFGGASQAAGRVLSRSARSADTSFGEAGPDAARAADSTGGSPCSCGCASFVAGTLVADADDALRPIEQVRVGDHLSGRTPGGETGAGGHVAELVRRDTQNLVRITLTTGEQIDTTPEHPFYRDRSGWIAAQSLAPGDLLATASGVPAVVASVEAHREKAPVSVYNFIVEGTHSYYVGQARLLVHNGFGKYCRAFFGAGVYKETWSNTALKKLYPNPDHYQKVQALIIKKTVEQNARIPIYQPKTSVLDKGKRTSAQFVREMFKIHFPNSKAPKSIYAALQQLNPSELGKQNVDEIVPIGHGGLAVISNQQAYPETLNKISGGVAGAIAKAHPGQPILKYEAEFIDDFEILKKE